MRNPAIVKWLDGIEPAWTMLDQHAFAALCHPDATIYGPIQLATDLTPAEVQQSALARNALIVLNSAATGPGLKMTATGNLSRAVVADLCDRTDWPGYDKAEMFKYYKVVNEPDYLPLFFLRHVTEVAKLIRRYKGYLKATPTGRKMTQKPNLGILASILFHITFWRFNLAYIWSDRLEAWPQSDIGIVLWSLSIVAHDWQTPERLTRLCTVPAGGLFDQTWDGGSSIMEARILQPLVWFGLLEFQDAELEPRQLFARRSYRKTSLFDRLVSFDIEQSVSPSPLH